MWRRNEGGRVLPGDLVQVRTWEEVRGTLDASGSLDGLPFMPEMRKFCGRRFVVTKRLERTCEEIKKEMRRIRHVVYLDDLRCDGGDHGGCTKGCCFFWKEAWLQRLSHDEKSAPSVAGEHVGPFPYEYLSLDGRYVCQSTELHAATTRMPRSDLVGMIVRDWRARTYSAFELLRIIVLGFLGRVWSRFTGRSYHHLEGTCTKTPTVALNLQPGEWVRVKQRDAVAATLDGAGRNRGLAFEVSMLPFCGGKYRVLRRLDTMIQERTRTLINVENTVILEGVICSGCHMLNGGCPRANYHYWREVWLERIPVCPPASPPGVCWPSSEHQAARPSQAPAQLFEPDPVKATCLR